MLFEILKSLTSDNKKKSKGQKAKNDKEKREMERKLWELAEEYEEEDD